MYVIFVGWHSSPYVGFKTYASMNSAQTTWASAIKRGGFDMVARTSGGYLLIYKKRYYNGKTVSI